MSPIEKAKEALVKISTQATGTWDHPVPYSQLWSTAKELAEEALAELDAEKPAEDAIEELQCVHVECIYYDTDFTDSCAAESNGEPASATCVKYLKSSHLIQQFAESYHQRKMKEMK